MTASFYTTLSTPVGLLILTATNDAITGLYLPNDPRYSKAANGTCDVAPFKEAITQLQEYFAGTRTVFDVQLKPQGSPFQQRVWEGLCTIPYGKTLSYGALATQIGNPKAARAVGLANSQNPISIFIPCHRVIGANGTLTGYAGGLSSKKWLLSHEGKEVMLFSA